MSERIWLLGRKAQGSAEMYLLSPAGFSIKTHLVLFRDITLSTDQYPNDPRVTIPGRGMERSIAVLKCSRYYNS